MHFPLLLFSPLYFIPMFYHYVTSVSGVKKGRINCRTLPAHQIFTKLPLMNFMVFTIRLLAFFLNIFLNSDYSKILIKCKYVMRFIIKFQFDLTVGLSVLLNSVKLVNMRNIFIFYFYFIFLTFNHFFNHFFSGFHNL